MRNTARLLLPIEPALRELPKNHIEEIVIWLKNMHNPGDPEDRSWTSIEPFKKQIEKLRDSPEQVAYQLQEGKKLRLVIQHGIWMGALSVLVVWLCVAGWYVSLILLLLVPVLWRRALLRGLDALLLAKDQEQRHVWESIRQATSVPDLQTAGFYAVIDAKDFNEHTQQMRDAIYRNGEDGYMFSTHLSDLKTGID